MSTLNHIYFIENTNQNNKMKIVESNKNKPENEMLNTILINVDIFESTALTNDTFNMILYGWHMTQCTIVHQVWLTSVIRIFVNEK